MRSSETRFNFAETLTSLWYRLLDYEMEDWKALASIALKQMNTYGDETRRIFEATFDNLEKHACAGTYGLG